MTPQQLCDRLDAEPSFGRFTKRDLILPAPLGICWARCLEEKTLNVHRAVVLFEMGNGVAEIAPLIEEVRACLATALRERFWRGLGLGLVLFSPQEVDSSDLKPSVASIATKTTIVQWLIHVSAVTGHIAAAHTWCATSTTAVFQFIVALDSAGGSNTTVVIVTPNEPWKSIFKITGWRI